MSKEVKIYHILGNEEYSNWVPNRVLVNSIEEADIVWGYGGADISPWIYGEKKGRYTQCDEARDKAELKQWRKAIELGKLLVGTCRSSQMLSALAGGRVVQDQDNPSYYHKMKTSCGKELLINSTHHEAAFPFELPKDEYKVLGWTEGISSYHTDGEEKEMNPPVECEIVYYPKIKGLGIQHHPEALWHDKESHKELFEYLHDLLNKHLTNQL